LPVEIYEGPRSDWLSWSLSAARGSARPVELPAGVLLDLHGKWDGGAMLLLNGWNRNITVSLDSCRSTLLRFCRLLLQRNEEGDEEGRAKAITTIRTARSIAPLYEWPTDFRRRGVLLRSSWPMMVSRSSQNVMRRTIAHPIIPMPNSQERSEM